MQRANGRKLTILAQRGAIRPRKSRADGPYQLAAGFEAEAVLLTLRRVCAADVGAVALRVVAKRGPVKVVAGDLPRVIDQRGPHYWFIYCSGFAKSDNTQGAIYILENIYKKVQSICVLFVMRVARKKNIPRGKAFSL